MQREVRMRPGSRYKQEDAEIIEREIDALIGDKTGVTAEEILEAGTPKRSPLHRFFDFDDRHAAHEHRLNQAREMARSVQIKVIRDDSESEWTRKYHPIVIRDEEPPAHTEYVPATTVAKNENYLEQVQANALRMWHSWERQYGQYLHLPQLSGVITTIETALASRHSDAVAAGD